jgi:hypothetical protein
MPCTSSWLLMLDFSAVTKERTSGSATAVQRRPEGLSAADVAISGEAYHAYIAPWRLAAEHQN